jgi:Leu/Phe-tRNA-protein transferase
VVLLILDQRFGLRENGRVRGWSETWVYLISAFHLQLCQYVLLDTVQDAIYQISAEDVLDPEKLRMIHSRPETFYWSDDWSPEFYILLAKTGFISICFTHPDSGQLLIPQIQASYAVLDWGNRRCGRSMKRRQRSRSFADQNYRLSLDHDLEEIIAGIQKTHGDESWLEGRYVELLQQLVDSDPGAGFCLTGTGLLARDGELIAGEMGYEVGKVYTSLTGFFHRENRVDNHAGKLQLHLLAEELESRGFAFWNLGQPEMAYKIQFGAKVVPRGEFLGRWSVVGSTVD